MDKSFLSIQNMCLTGAFVIAAICFARLLLKKAPKIISYLSFSEGGIKVRIKNVLNFKRPSRIILLLAAAIMIVLSVGFALNRVGTIDKRVMSPQAVQSLLSKYLPGEIWDNLPDFREEELEDRTLYLWSAWDDDSFVHKVEFIITDGAPIQYHYKNYYYSGIRENRITMDQAFNMVKEFTKDFLTEGSELVFENQPANFSLYDPGKVESWVAQKDGMEYIVMINLEYGYVEYFSKESNEAYETLRESFPDDLGGKQMTLEDIHELAKKGESLVFADFSGYLGGNASSNLSSFLMVYHVKGGYRLIVSSKGSGKPDRVSLESIWEGGNTGIDIRYGDLEAFLQTYPSQDAITEEEAREIAQTGLGLELEPVSWNILGDWPERTDGATVFARALLDSLDTLNEACWVFRIKIQPSGGAGIMLLARKAVRSFSVFYPIMELP
ncbi:MAG: hypothetical protein FWF85_09980 [Clostridiales bacterium]|nr:hypothetical protein [Clostridiales bacterium]